MLIKNGIHLLQYLRSKIYRVVVLLVYHDIFLVLFLIPCRVGLVVNVSASQTVCREFASRPGHTKDHHKNGTDCLPAWHAMRWGRGLAVQLYCLKGRVVCGTVYGDIHLKDLLGSIVKIGYRIPVPDFYLVLHGLRCRRRHYNGLNLLLIHETRHGIDTELFYFSGYRYI